MNNKHLAPICLFVYNRLSETKQTITSLQQIFLAKESDLFIFSDGAKTESAIEKVSSVRKFVKSLSGFKSISIIESDVNKGLANSIISGVTNIIEQYGKVIVIEDDLLTSPNFLNFMNQGLDFYEEIPGIISVSGYNMKVRNIQNKDYPYDIFFAMRLASWGWATWKNRWSMIDWTLPDFIQFSKDKRQQRKFNQMGSDMCKMLKNQQMGLNDSWAIRFCYHQFMHKLYSVYPFISKVRNIGFSSDATHTRYKYNRFDVSLDSTNQIDFLFRKNVILNKQILSDFRNTNSIQARLYSKFRFFLEQIL
ncbi:glycosyl transferase [Bacteroidia bacterium]|nr:glycosyl transferase [Bacteroidia bacterium]